MAGASLVCYPGAIPETLDDAYRIQDLAVAHVADSVGGWKVGRILPPFSVRLGSERLAGPIFTGTISHADGFDGQIGRVFEGGFGAAEAEFLLRIGIPPKPGKTAFSLEEAAALIDRVHVGIEIASSPLAAINDLGSVVTASDFGNNNGLIIGPEIVGWPTSGFSDWTVITLIDGIEAGRGTGAAFPDGPIGSARFLFELMAKRNIALSPGTWISSGAVSGVHSVRPGQRVEARFGSVLSISCTIEAATQR